MKTGSMLNRHQDEGFIEAGSADEVCGLTIVRKLGIMRFSAQVLVYPAHWNKCSLFCFNGSYVDEQALSGMQMNRTEFVM